MLKMLGIGKVTPLCNTSLFTLFVQQELELLPAKELQNNVYIKHSVSLEQVPVMYIHTCIKLQFLSINYVLAQK